MKTHVDFLDPISLTSGKLPLDSLLNNSVYRHLISFAYSIRFSQRRGPIASSTVIMNLLKRK